MNQFYKWHRYIFVILLLVISANLHAQFKPGWVNERRLRTYGSGGTKRHEPVNSEWDSARFIIKAYPVDFFGGQLPNCCWQVRTSLEYRLAPHHSLQFGLSGYMPNYLTHSMVNYTAMMFRGARGMVGYRYYFQANVSNAKLIGFYIGGEVGLTYLITGKQQDDYAHYDGEEIVPGSEWHSPVYNAHGIMTTYCATAGYVIGLGRHGIIDIGIGVGYRYDYFWRHFAAGNLEFDRNAGFYGYIKELPIAGTVNVGIGGMF